MGTSTRCPIGLLPCLPQILISMSLDVGSSSSLQNHPELLQHVLPGSQPSPSQRGLSASNPVNDVRRGASSCTRHNFVISYYLNSFLWRWISKFTWKSLKLHAAAVLQANYISLQVNWPAWSEIMDTGTMNMTFDVCVYLKVAYSMKPCSQVIPTSSFWLLAVCKYGNRGERPGRSGQIMTSVR